MVVWILFSQMREPPSVIAIARYGIYIDDRNIEDLRRRLRVTDQVDKRSLWRTSRITPAG